jgi:hypothetical protein
MSRYGNADSTTGSEVFTSANRKLCEAARASGLHVANPVETASEATTEVLSDFE